MDEPNEVVVNILRAMEVWEGSFIALCTGRVETFRPQTLKWLNENRIPFDALLMRAVGDKRSDFEVKSDMIPADANISFIIEDRDSVVQMWRQRGYIVLQPAESGY